MEEKIHNEEQNTEGNVIPGMPEYLFCRGTHNRYLTCQAWVSDREKDFSVACQKYLELANKPDIANNIAEGYYNSALVNGLISEAGPTKDFYLAKLFVCEHAAQNNHYILLQKFYRSELLVDEDFRQFEPILEDHQKQAFDKKFSPLQLAR